MTTNTALQVTNFNFYGDELIALRDNATGEIYAAINHILRNIGFTEIQIRKRRDKWLQDIVLSKGITKFSIPYNYDDNLETDQKRSPLDNYEMYCISNRKLPLALAKINITPKMKQTQPELSSKLELYQDKCADVLASVFIDKISPSQDLSPLLESITSLNLTMTKLQEQMTQLKESQLKKNLPESRHLRWITNTFKKLNTLLSYVNENSDQNLKLQNIIHLVIKETEDTYDIEINDYVDIYRCEYGLDTNPYALTVIDYYKNIRDMFTLTLDSIMERLHLHDNTESNSHRSIFDELATKLKTA